MPGRMAMGRSTEALPPPPTPRMSALAHLFAIIAPTCSLAGAVPTAARPLRSRSVAGLSFASATLGLICSELWFAYGLMIADVPQIATNGVWLVLRAALAVALVVSAAPSQRARRAAAVVAATLGSLVVVALGVGVVASVATVLTVTYGLPQLWWTLRHGPGAGLSRYAVMLSISSSTSWTVYGVATGDRAVVACSSIAMVTNGVLLAATITEPGTVLLGLWRHSVVAAHLDAVIVRSVTHAVPAVAVAVERHLPTAAAGIRERHRHLRARLAHPAVHVALPR